MKNQGDERKKKERVKKAIDFSILKIQHIFENLTCSINLKDPPRI